MAINGEDRESNYGYFPVIAPEDSNPYIRVKVTFLDYSEKVLNIPFPKIIRGTKTSYSIKIKFGEGGIRKIKCKDLSIKPAGGHVIDVEGECNVENLKNGDRVELFVTESSMGNYNSSNNYCNEEKYRDVDYKSSSKFKFQTYAITNCGYVIKDAYKFYEIKMNIKAKIFNSIGLLVGGYNLLPMEEEYEDNYTYRLLCSDIFEKLERGGYCMDPESKNFGELAECDSVEDGSPKKPSDICDMTGAINFGEPLPCRQLLIGMGLSNELGSNVVDLSRCGESQQKTHKILAEILSTEESSKYKFEARIKKNLQRGYLDYDIFEIKGLIKREERKEEIESDPHYRSVWELDVTQKCVPDNYHNIKDDYFYVEIRAIEISTGVVVARGNVKIYIDDL